MTHTIRSDDLLQVKLCESDTVQSVLQNISVILSTRKGTVPMYREFGIDMEFLDKPAEVAKTLMASSIQEAVEKFEPRATVKNISFKSDDSVPGKMVVILEVEINEQE